LIEVRKDWTIFYNLANTLSALGEYEVAKKTYIKSLKYSRIEAIVWKNLGTCYSHLGDHKRELKCINIALSINPQLSQALISKGITLGVVYEKYADGLKLINSALENDKLLAYHWPIAHYWKAKFLSNLNENPKALNELDVGLGIAPDNIYLLNLKAQILSHLWRFDRNYLLKAAEIYESRIRINEGELQSIKELALIYHELGQDDKFLDYALILINSFAELSHPLGKKDIEAIKISTTNIMHIINNIYMYDGYRESKPLNEYIEYFGDEFAIELDMIFWLFFGTIFAKTCDAIKESKEWKEISWSYISRQNELLFIEFLPLITKEICKKYSDSSKKKRMNIMSEAIVNLPYIILLETSREIGYLAGYYGGYYSVSSEEIDYRMDESIDNSDVGVWYNNVIEIVISNTNDALHIFGDEACKIFSREL
jgi:tetratricopeptide (TPR) repeat protein